MSSAALIAVDGVAPGIGKSTLVEGLARSYAGQGCRVDRFAEAEIITRPVYAEVGRQFRTTGRVDPDALLAATADDLDALDAAGVQVAVLDALLPFVPSLLAWGHDRAAISRFLGALTHRFGARRVVLVYLDGVPEQALVRAEQREDPTWPAWLIGRFAGVAGAPVHDAASLVAHLRDRRRLTLDLLGEQGWTVLPLEAGVSSATDRLAAAMAGLAGCGVPIPAP